MANLKKIEKLKKKFTIQRGKSVEYKKLKRDFFISSDSDESVSGKMSNQTPDMSLWKDKNLPKKFIEKIKNEKNTQAVKLE